MAPDTSCFHLLSKPDSSMWVSFGPLTAAMAAVILTSIVTWKVARSQVKSNSRQTWLNEVRTKLARCMLLYSNVQKDVQAGNNLNPNTIEELLLLRYELELYLNPEKPLQQKILEDLASAYTACIRPNFQDAAVWISQIGMDGQALAREVWKKVKKGQ